MTTSVQSVQHGMGRSRPIVWGVLALLCGLVWTVPGWPQMPDNRGVKLDPEDAISPAYEYTLDERDQQRLDAAREHGEDVHLDVPRHGTGAGGGPAAGRAARRRRSGPYRRQAGACPAGATPPPGIRDRDAAGGTGRGGRRGPRGDGGCAAGELDPSAADRADTLSRPGRRGWPAMRHAPTRRRPPRGTAPAMRSCPRFGRVTASTPEPSTRSIPTIPAPWCWSCCSRRSRAPWRTGQFERVRGRLVIRLTSLTWRGRTIPVEAWAVDPACACYGIEGDVDRHFVSRVLLPAAARFAEGFLSAVAMPARTLTVDDGAVFHERAEAGTEEALYAGAAAATRTLGDILMADAPKETTVRVPRNTALVVTFASPPEESR